MITIEGARLDQGGIYKKTLPGKFRNESVIVMPYRPSKFDRLAMTFEVIALPNS